MDIFGAVATTVHEIHVAFVFVKGVIDDVRSYGSDKAEIEAHLSHEILFFRQFKALFFDDDKGEAFFRRQPPDIQQDCEQSLTRLQGVLAEYQVKAARYGLDEPAEEVTGITRDNQDVVKIVKGKESESRIAAFNARFAAKVGDLKKKAIHWSIFDKEKIIEMVGKAREWMLRLRETVSWMLMVQGSAELISAHTGTLSDTALGRVIKRQMLVRETVVDHDFGPLTGTLDSHVTFDSGLKVVTYRESFRKEEVIIEARPYDQALKEAYASASEAQILELLEPVRQLAWLLHKAMFQEGVKPDSPDALGWGLEFKGYLNFPEQSCVVFLYHLPGIPAALTSRVPPKTLYDLINDQAVGGSNPVKESLGNRFLMAYTLANSVLNIHSSLWLHKNIRSSVLVMLPRPNSRHQHRAQLQVPYIMGWGVARPESGKSSLSPSHETIANLYRHPKRQGEPTVHFQPQLDAYSVGAVLVEIGLWMTLDKLFAKEIAQKKVMPLQLVRWWEASGREFMKSGMGEGYVEAIDRCLEPRIQRLERTKRLLDFRKEVVEVLAKGLDV